MPGTVGEVGLDTPFVSCPYATSFPSPQSAGHELEQNNLKLPVVQLVFCSALSRRLVVRLS